MTTINRKEEIASPAKTKDLLRRFDINLKKSLGQNFLVDRNVLHKIVSAAELDETKGVLEIGPGIGALTQRLAQVAGKVVAVEIDSRLLPALQETMIPYPHVALIHGDILKLDLSSIFREHFAGLSSISVVANLPYYITTPIVMKLLEERLPLENIVVMVQKEVAERMAASPGGKDYGSLSIAVQYYCDTELVAYVPHSVFFPPPKVDSIVIKLKRLATPRVQAPDEAFFFRVVQACFAQRRKTILNNLLNFFGKPHKAEVESALLQSGIDPLRRGETLGLQEFAQLSGSLLPLKEVFP